MGFDIHILGTSSARPTGSRQVSGSIVVCDEGVAVVDAGEGFQSRFAVQRKRMKQFADSQIKVGRVDVLCLTHGHLDHTWGVLPWLHTLSLDKRDKPLLIIGPTSREVLDSLLSNSDLPGDISNSDLIIQWRSWHQLGGTTNQLGFPVRWVLGDVENDRWVELLPDSNSVIQLEKMPQPQGWSANKIQALPTTHTIPSCGWHFSSKAKKGKFDRLRAAELKLTEAQRAGLARGEDQTLDDGKILSADEFRAPDSGIINVVLSGDTSEMAKGITSLEHCNVLVHESTFLEDWSEQAINYLHSTASGAARTAISSGAKHLVLTHFGARIKGTEELLSQAQEQLADSSISLSAASDGDRIQVSNSGKVTHHYWAEQGWSN
ncbi:MAG: MBL fold metallo-hydrolase [Candidatus Poseidoniaceae archaeon]|nr:MBL fold metallo-hydrolase [Candidatus Poseidoniaceae archaeon]